jgi:hypothetical protein
MLAAPSTLLRSRKLANSKLPAARGVRESRLRKLASRLEMYGLWTPRPVMFAERFLLAEGLDSKSESGPQAGKERRSHTEKKPHVKENKVAETYQLACWSCFSRIEIPCGSRQVCVRCGSGLSIEWEQGRAAIAASVPGRRTNSLRGRFPRPDAGPARKSVGISGQDF